MKTPTGTVPDQKSETDLKVRDAEDMLKRVFAIAQIIANAPSPSLELSDQDQQAAQKHSSHYLQ